MMTAEPGLQPRSLRVAAWLPIFFAIVGCSALQIAPIQLGRIAQLETYSHTYDFGKDANTATEKQINRKIENTFSLLLGEKNWQALKDRYGFNDIRDELIAKSIQIKGVAQFYISIDPENQQRFLLEGTGKYLLLRDKTKAIMLSGDFIAPPAMYQIADLDAGLLSIDVNLYTTRIPGETTYYQEGVVVKYQIRIDTSRKSDGVYRIDYGAVHGVHLLSNKDDPVSAENKIGELRFDYKNLRANKLLDVRGLNYLRTYE